MTKTQPMPYELNQRFLVYKSRVLTTTFSNSFCLILFEKKTFPRDEEIKAVYTTIQTKGMSVKHNDVSLFA